jgi:outer membrane receptor protein involved in Fe transport
MYSWPEDIALKAYNDISFSSSYTWDKRFGALIFTAAVTNLMDTAYATLLGYPEPGRSFRLTMTYEFN